MPNTTQERMEDMSVAYIQALCANVGYSAEIVKRDNDGVDLSVKCKDRPTQECRMLSPQLNIQLKSSFSKVSFDQNNNLKYILEVKNYNNLIEPNRFIPSILVLLHMHKDEKLWIEHTRDFLKITKCAYWVNLKGLPKSNNAESITITIPKDNILNGDTLRSLMIKVANHQEL